MSQTVKYFEEHWPQFLKDLQTLVRIPSVSFPGFDPENVQRSADEVERQLKEAGLENVQQLKMEGAFPYVYGDWLHAEGAPTVLLYAHHDVQPPGRENVWKTEPFEPTFKDGPGGERMYARGAADDKAGILVHTASITSYLKTVGKLPINVKVLIEGEEEIGSNHLFDFLKKYSDKLQSDVMVLTDTLNFDCGVPGLTVALRGMVGFGVEIRALKNTLHSGMWGGPVPDPAMALCKVLSGLTDENGQVALPEINAMVPAIGAQEEQDLKSIPYDEAKFREQCGMVDGAQLLKHGPSVLAQTWKYPSVSVNAFEASSRKQAGNIINDAAWARVTMRLAAGMDAQKVSQILKDYFKKATPWGLELNLHEDMAGDGWSIDPYTEKNEKAFQAAEQALEKGYQKSVIKFGCGGSIPFVQPFSDAFGGAPALLVGVEDPYTNAHGENESLLVDDLRKACLSQIYLFEELAKKL